ncbi:MAG: family 14 glycosylhydrolase, partial [Myxococcota bacterium]
HERPGEPSAAYDPMVRLFKEMDAQAGDTRVVLHFTCLEMDDKGDERPRSLVSWVGAAAARHEVTIKGENALPVYGQHSWNRIGEALHNGYSGLTVLRLPLSHENLQGLAGLTSRYVDAARAGAQAALGG